MLPNIDFREQLRYIYIYTHSLSSLVQLPINSGSLPDTSFPSIRLQEHVQIRNLGKLETKKELNVLK